MIKENLKLISYQDCLDKNQLIKELQNLRRQKDMRLYNPVMDLTNRQLDLLLSQELFSVHDLSKSLEKKTFRRFYFYEDQLAATITLKNFNPLMKHVEVGYSVVSAFQSKGVGSHILFCMMKDLFSYSSYQRVYAHVHFENKASMTVLKNNAFLEEGVLRNHYIINGSFVNEVIFGLLRFEFLSYFKMN